ncbi:hypothetical protein RUM44_001410 [Polyplax serrata]|uniref:Uncharacterized protein n=1 Tax=Polyplax serrata TaxID=468196 RepID=A0ABR1ALN6_POLSC
MSNKTTLKGNMRYDTCPDVHNLTMMSFAGKQEELNSDTTSEWDISIEDLKELIKENEKIPKTEPEKRSFVNTISQNLMAEAEIRIRNLFHAKSRQARFSGLHFPSMEGSLMTISMLLFGVYLSKLIVKLLQSHYAKFNMPIRTIGAIRTPIILTQRRAERAAQDMDMWKLQFMNMIDKYTSRFN